MSPQWHLAVGASQIVWAQRREVLCPSIFNELRLEGGILTAHGASEFQRIEVRLVVFSEETVSSEVQTKSRFSTSHGALDLEGHDNMPFAVC